MKPSKALTLSLGEHGSPVITRYDLSLKIYTLYRDKTYEGNDVKLQKSEPERHDFNRYLKQLLEDGVLQESNSLPNGVYSILGSSNIDPGVAACSIDPFSFLSHLSALSYHGLTNRIPSTLYISSPTPADWKTYAEDKMHKDLGDDYVNYKINSMPRLTRVKMQKINRTPIHTHYSKHSGAFKIDKGNSIRVSTIGRTFLDAIRTPSLCGGINHVLEIYKNNAASYVKLIMNEAESHGTDIDKVRIGYILDERLGISNDQLESWTKYAQRGGSRKLDASAEYEPVWSEKWCISINTFDNF